MAIYRIVTMAGSVACALIAMTQVAAAAQSNAEMLASNLQVTLQHGQNFGHDKVCINLQLSSEEKTSSFG